MAGMVKNRHLARAISDAGFSEVRRQLTYKTAWAGGTLVVADRYYPPSKSCSACWTVKAKLSLAERYLDSGVHPLAEARAYRWEFRPATPLRAVTPVRLPS